MFSEKIKTIFINCTNKMPSKFRLYFYKKFGLIKYGDTCDIRKGVYFDNIYNLEIGNNVMINRSVSFYTGDSSNVKIKIKNNVYIGMNVNFICVSHNIGGSNQRAGTNKYEDIVINKGTWIGANSLILPGVHVGEGCIIAAGSVVVSDCEDNYLYAGNPARKKKRL